MRSNVSVQSTLIYATGVAIQNEDDLIVKKELEEVEELLTTPLLSYESVYEVWVGDDMIDDQLNWETARKLAEKYRKEEPADISVVIDEHRYYKIEKVEDIDKVEAGKVVESYGS